MAISAIGGSNSSSAAGRVRDEALRELNMDDFLQLMIAELQNQDPLNPLDNAQLLQQISQIREIAATGSLSETLESVMFGQSISNASNLIGKQVRALNDAGDFVTGEVEKVAIAEGQVKVHIGSNVIGINNISEILAG